MDFFLYKTWFWRKTPRFATSGQISQLWVLKYWLTAPEIAKIGIFGIKFVHFK